MDSMDSVYLLLVFLHSTVRKIRQDTKWRVGKMRETKTDGFLCEQFENFKNTLTVRDKRKINFAMLNADIILSP